jgi:type I restriction enzyme S subunit
MPSDENLGIFNDQVFAIEEKLKLNATQIRTLENLRDTLLPKLMSGEVRVHQN